MALNEPQEGSNAQLEFARKMAESLLKSQGYANAPSADLIKTPGAWAYNVPNLLNAISGARYRDQSISQENKLLTKRAGNTPTTSSMLDPSKTSETETEPGPGLTKITTEGGVPFTVAAEHADRFKGALADLEAAGYKIDPTQSGGYNNRNIRGTNIPSLHGKGAAIDINWDRNQVSGQTDIDPVVARAISKKWGLKWGGDFKNEKNKDYMHFEIDPNAKYTPPAVATNSPDMSGRMNLGGPEIPSAGAPPVGPSPAAEPVSEPATVKTAQAFNSTVANEPTKPHPIFVPGYGHVAVPPVPYLETTDQLEAGMRLAKDPNDVLKDYQKRAQGHTIELPTGQLHVAPRAGGGQPIISFTPKGGPFEPGKLLPQVGKGGEAQLGLTVPGGANGDNANRLSSRKVTEPETPMETLTRDQAVLAASAKATGGLTDAKVKTIDNAIQAGATANPIIKTIDTMMGLSKSAVNIPRGPTSPWMTALRQLADNFAIPIPANTSEGEALQKLNAGLASQATRAISNRGTNFELETFIKNNPGLLQTKQGMEMLLDIIRQEQQGYQDIAKIANRTKGHDVDSYAIRVDEYYKNNPIKFDHILPNGKTIRMNTKKIESEDDVNGLKSGEGFIGPNGKIGVKP